MIVGELAVDLEITGGQTKRKVSIKTAEDANLALREIGKLKDQIEKIQTVARGESRKVLEEADAKAKPVMGWLKAYEKELERWARDNERDFPPKTRTMNLTFGKLFFRLSPPAIKLIRKVDYVLERLRAKKMTSCIRIKEEVNKEALEAYPDEVLKEIGCKRGQKDEFYYEVSRPEVKG